MSTASHSAPLRLAQYLREFVGLRTTTVRDFNKYESVLWFGEMPQESDCQSAAWTDDHDVDAAWLEVKKQRFDKAPPPPDVVLPWSDQTALKRATPQIATLRSRILLPDDKAGVEDGETPPLVEHFLDDHPAIKQAYERYRPTWEAWSAEQRRRERIQQLYADLFRLHTQLRKEGEIVELVLGLGLLEWRAELNRNVIPIRRHTVVAQVELEFDPAKGVLRVGPPGEGARLKIEDDMLEAELRPDRRHYAVLEDQLGEIGDDIWDKARMFNALKTWAGALNASSQWSDGLEPQTGSDPGPKVTFAPALILRKRSQTSMVRIYDALIDQLSDESHEVPEGWNGLIDDVDDIAEDAHSDSDPSSSVSGTSVPSEVYFPLPTNREQRRIVDAIDRQRGVIVQGPPGTGKSHTIANLICHLLATGKRVLITAETGRALQVLKEKLPKEIQPLCVSLLGQGGDAFAELNSAVQGITTKQASYTPGAYTERIAEIDRDIDTARRRLAETAAEIRSLREGETIPHSIAQGAYSGTASSIADRVARERSQYAWLKLPNQASESPPLSKGEMIEWLAIQRRYSDHELREGERRIPSSQTLTPPTDFAAAVEAEKAVESEAARQATLRTHPAYASICALDAEARAQFKQEIQLLEEKRFVIGRTQEQWRQIAIQDAILGRRARWVALLQLTRDRIARAQKLLARLGDRVVSIPNGLDPARVRADAVAAILHFRQGGKWKQFGFFTPKNLKARVYLKDEVLVDGRGTVDGERLQAVCDYLDIESALEHLASAWQAIGVSLPEHDRRIRVAVLEEHAAALDECCAYAEECRRIAQSMSSQTLPIPEPDWISGGAQKWLELIDAVSVEDRKREASERVSSTSGYLASMEDLHDAHPVIKELITSVESRDVGAYSLAHARLVGIEALRQDRVRRAETEEALANVVPGLVEAVARTTMDPGWDERFAAWPEAWRWAVADSWLDKRSDFEYQQGLWRRHHEIERDIGHLLAEAAALRAWTHFFDRLKAPEAAALKSWREAVKSMGKGTGRSAKLARLRREARRYMDSCRDAIPVWIMPRYLVAEMIEPTPSRYDLVIVDEASQLGIESLFLFYIARKLVVVGDDQQISPYGVGIADEAIAGLQHHYLDGIRHQHALSAQSSLYANAKIRFSQNIVLREHFRCMPEIIQFSNDLCYASNGTPLDPLRAYPANRLQPVVLRQVSNGYRIGGPQHAQNPPEADAIVAQIAACVTDPRYSKATMGVISLQGEAQAKLIERNLLEHLDPAIIEERRLICGDAYAFQGDERNIIFLSMVAAPGERRIGALTSESARQRFNVAVSRAQDQLWLFHTATLDVLSDACMRHRLLSYMLEPGRQTSEEHEQRFESTFERDVFRQITERGFHLRTQVCVGDPTNHRYRIDLVVEGMQGRLAVECDGDAWHGPERYEHDMARQRDLERAGWQFARIRGGEFYRNPAEAMEPIWAELERLGIRPGGVDSAAAEPPAPIDLGAGDEATPVAFEGDVLEPDSAAVDAVLESLSDGVDTMGPENPRTHSRLDPAEKVVPTVLTQTPGEDREKEPFPREAPATIEVRMPAPYAVFEGNPGPDPRDATPSRVAQGLCRIIEVEGPMLAKRAYDIYLRGCDIRRLGGELKRSMNQALQHAIRNGQVVKEDESSKGGLLYSVVRLKGTAGVGVVVGGPRFLEDIPPSVLNFAGRRLAAKEGFETGSDAHLRALLDFFDLKRLTVQAGTALLEVFNRNYPYVDRMIDEELR